MPTVPTDYRKIGQSGNEVDDLLGSGASPREPQAGQATPTPDFRPTNDVDALLDAPDVAAPNDVDALFNDEPLKKDLNTAVQYGAQKNADESARVLRLHKTMGLPEDLVERNSSELEVYEKIDGLDVPALVRSSPVIADWLSKSPHRVSATWRDLPRLKDTERMVKEHTLFSALSNSIWELAGKPQPMEETTTSSSIKSGAYGAAARTAATPGYILEGLRSAPWLPERYKRLMRPAISDGMVESFTNNPATKYFSDLANDYKTEEMGKSITETFEKEGLEAAIRVAAIQVASNAPNMAATIALTLSGHPDIAAAQMGFSTAGGRFKEVLDGKKEAQTEVEIPETVKFEGIDIPTTKGEQKSDVPASASNEQSFMDATIQGAAEAAFERLGTIRFVKEWQTALTSKFGKATAMEVVKGVVKTFSAAFAQEGLEEGGTEIVQQLAPHLAGTTVRPMNLEEVKRIARASVDATLVGAASGTAYSAPSVSAAAGIKTMSIKQAKRDAEIYKQLGKKWEEVESREKIPGMVGEVIAEITKDGPLEKIHVSPQALEKALGGENPVVVMKDLGLLKEYEEAKLHGTDIAIPLAKWSDKFVGTPIYDALRDDIKFDPSKPSVNELKELQKQEQKKIEDEAKKAEEEAAKPQDNLRAAIDEHVSVLPEDQRQAQADEMERKVRTRALRLGLTPLALFEREKVPIVTEGEGDLEQEALPNAPALATEQLFRDEFKVRSGQAEAYRIGSFFFQDLGNGQVARMIRNNFQYGFSQADKIALADLPKWLAKNDKTGSVYKALGLDTKLYQTNLPAVKGQTLPALQPTLSPIGLYSQLEDEVLKMDFKSIPAKDLAGRIKNLAGIKQDELVWLGLQEYLAMHEQADRSQFFVIDNTEGGSTMGLFPEEEAKIHVAADPTRYEVKKPDGKVTKDQVLNFIRNNSVQVEQTVFGQVDEERERVTDVWGVKLTDEIREKAKAQQLFQPDTQGPPRGAYDRLERFIQLNPNADLSTLLHEGAHARLEEDMRDYLYIKSTNQTGAFSPEQKQFMESFEGVMKWLGVDAPEKITDIMHEKVARAYELYFLTGKAPTPEVEGFFAKISAWLFEIYKSYKNGYFEGITLSPEVTRYFDEQLATREEIDAAVAAQNMKPLFPELMQDAEKANRLAALDITQGFMEKRNKEAQRRLQERRGVIRKEVEAEVNVLPEYIALSVLGRGKLPDGSALPKDQTGGFSASNLAAIKLNKEELKQLIGDEGMKLLPKPYLYAQKGGVSPDVAAEIFGFGSGDEMMNAIMKAPPRDQVIDQETDRRLKSETPDALLDGTLQVEAMKAIHNDHRAKILERELQILHTQMPASFRAIGNKIARPLPTAQAVRERAKNTILGKQAREINPFAYQRAEAKAAKEAAEFFFKGDIESAFNAKERELLNHELYRAAITAKEMVDQKVGYAQHLGKASVREKIGLAGSDYLEQMDAILGRYDLRKGISLKAIDKRKSLAKWVAEQADEGHVVNVPEKLLRDAEKMHYKDMTYGEILEVMMTVEQIHHLAVTKNELLANKDQRDIEALEDQLLSTIQAHFKLDGKVEDLTPDMKDKFISGAKHAFAEHTRMEFLFEKLDGMKAGGPFWRAFFKPFADAEASEVILAKKDEAAMKGIWGRYTTKERKDWYTKKRFIPGAVTEKFSGNLTKAEAFSMALNWGNSYNREALMEGYGFSETQVNEILDTMLDAKDIETVNLIWTHIDTYWPDVAALEKEVRGVAPEKVQGSAYKLKAGELKGGYYPIKFNNDLSYRQWQLDEKAALGEMFGSATRAMTRHGHAIERTNTGGKPLLLQLGVIASHLTQVRHDLTHRKAVIDVARLVNRPKIRAAIEQAVGRQMYRQLNPWLKGIAGDAPDVALQHEKWLSRLRSNATTVVLGLKGTTGIIQALGYLNVVDELGRGHALRGLAKNPFQWKQHRDFVFERSVMMRERMQNYDRDIRDYMQKRDVITQGNAWWFYHIGFMDLALSIPAWMAAYQKAMDGHLENIEKGSERAAIDYADSVIRKTMAAGAAKDLARVQRGDESKKLLTSFYSQLAIQFNLSSRVIPRFMGDKNFGTLATAAVVLWILPALLPDLIRGGGPDDDDEWPTWMMRKIALYPLSLMVVLRDVGSMLDWKFQTGRRAKFSASPAFQAIEAVGNAVGSAAKVVDPDAEFTRNDIKEIVNASGYLTGLPTRQVWMTLDYLYDYMTGEYQPKQGVVPEPIKAGWEALITGKPRE